MRYFLDCAIEDPTHCRGEANTTGFAWCERMADAVGAGQIETNGYIRWAEGILVLGRYPMDSERVIYTCPWCGTVIRTRPISFEGCPD